jgi:hypothetical protein
LLGFLYRKMGILWQSVAQNDKQQQTE